MKKLILAFAFGIGSLSLFAGEAVDAMTQDATVLMTSLSARQRYPWNGKVDIDFSFTCTIPEAFAFVNFKATYKDKDGNTVEVPMKTFDQFTTAFCTNAGTYRVTWDSVADAPNLRVTNLQYTVTANMAKYMVVDLSKGLKATADDPYPVSYLEECPDPTRDDGGWTDEYKTTKMVFRLVQPGDYRRGWNQPFRNWNDCGACPVGVSRPFYMAIFECTQGQAAKVYSKYSASSDFSGGQRSMRPAAKLTYNSLRGSADGDICWPNTGSAVDETSLIGELRMRTGRNGGFDLPTEVEWEYAARAGKTATGAWGDDGLSRDAVPSSETGTPTSGTKNSLLDTLGRYKRNGGYLDNGSGGYTAPASDCDETHGTAVVGSYKPNAWGFYDMLGNADELVLDYASGSLPWGGATVYDGLGPTVPAGSAIWNTPRRVRGGSYADDAKICSFAYRADMEAGSTAGNHGVRLCWRFPTPAQAAQ